MSLPESALLHAEWPAPPGVKACVTTREGGVSVAPFLSFNLAGHVGDAPAAVAANRQRLVAHLPAEPVWLEQVHGVGVVRLDAKTQGSPRADAAITRERGVVCAVLTADCLPVLLCDQAGSVVGVAHAGWRGLAAGVIEQTVAAMGVPAQSLLAWLGPAIGPQAFEVGEDVVQAFVSQAAADASAFTAHSSGKWRADLYALARARLKRLGVGAVWGGEACTYRESARFFSYRRDGATGRMASLIWLE